MTDKIDVSKKKLGYYQHYKGQHYQVLGFGQHSETREELVFYRALYGDFGLWARPLDMFFENVFVDGQSTERFKFIKQDSAI